MLDHAFAYVAGGFAAYCLGFYVIADAAAWNRNRMKIAAANRARRQARMDWLIEAADFAMWRAELGAPLPVIDIEEWDK